MIEAYLGTGLKNKVVPMADHANDRENKDCIEEFSRRFAAKGATIG